MQGEIPKSEKLEEKVFSISNEEMFHSIALEVYHFQYSNNSIYRDYCNLLQKTPATVSEVNQIPFLPISFFKTHQVKTTTFDSQLIFQSSGTTGSVASTHYVKNPELYRESFRRCFKHFYGPVEQYCILGLLPSYLERGQSSLVYMVNDMIENTGQIDSGFYLYELEALYKTLQEHKKIGQKTILIGVTYALLDFAAQFPLLLTNTIVMETGGMKGRKKELTRTELYTELKKAFGVAEIHSEYGMTELLSQAYAINGFFRTPAWMKILLRDETDPLTLISEPGSASGAINVIDLANLYSCSFIATEDIGKTHAEGYFEVLGRMDNSDIRGCSLLSF